MESKLRDFMTNDMLEVFDPFQSEMEEECLYCLEKLKKANKAGNISLPHKNEKGVLVRQNARLVVNAISDYWFNRIQKASKFVSRDFEDKYELYKKDIQ